MAGQGPHQRPVAALGPQIGVHRPDRALDGGLGADPHEVGGQPGRGLHRLALVGAVGRLPHEDHVHVGDVIELVAAALAHRDDGEAALGRVGGGGAAGDGERRAQGGGGEVGQFGGGLRDIGRPAHVTGRDGEQTAPVGDPQRHRVGRVGETPLELLDARVQVRRLVRGQGPPVARVPGQVVAERLGRAQHPEQPVAQRLRADQGVEQDPAVGRFLSLHQPYEAAQRQVGVGDGAERFQEHRVGPYGCHVGEFEEPLGLAGVGEAVPQQSGERTASAPRHRHPAVSCRAY